MNWFKKKEQVEYGAEYSKVSYAQCGEDLIINHIFTSLKIEKPSYWDIGAHHPYYLSNTAFFYKSGSRGINIEPDPTLISNFEIARPNDLNLGVGIGKEDGELDFYVINVPTLNTFDKSVAEGYKDNGKYHIKDIRKIEVCTIGRILRMANGLVPDFISIDAEGIDDTVLKGLADNGILPKVICIETISFSTVGRGDKNTSLINDIISLGYLHYADTNINSIFVKRGLWLR